MPMNRGQIKKGIFAIAVVAMTAAVGVVGFANAAPARALPLANGYGTGIDAVLEALEVFQDEVRMASDQYRSDIQACFGNTEASLGEPGASALRSAEADIDKKVTQVTDQLSKKTAGSTGASANVGALENKLNSETNVTIGALDSANSEVEKKIAPFAHNSQRGELRRCLREARNDFRSAIHEARQDFLRVVRNAF